MSPEISHCPACDSAETVQVGGWASSFDTDIGGRTFHQPPYSIRCCERCGLHFKSRTVPLDQLDDLYARLDSSTYEFDWNYPTDDLVRRSLEALASGSRVLDFGCSTGRILSPLTSRLRCYGVEANVKAAAVAKDRGIDLLSEQQLRDGRGLAFDAIVLTDVYEHLPQPVPLVRLLVDRLKPGGMLVVCTGNADAVAPREFIGEFWYFRTPQHLHMLGERHVTWIASLFGLRVEALHRCSHYKLRPIRKLREHVQRVAYFEFRLAPRSLFSTILRLVPGLRSAERWPAAPAFHGGQDHVVAIFRKINA